MAGQARDPDARPRALDAPGRGGRWWPTWLLAAAVLGLAVVSLGLGQFPLAPRTVMTTLWSAIAGVPSGVPAAATNVVMDVRLPRVVAAMLVGASLAVAGAAYQTLFRNPLASPAILGVSAGAGFGAALAMLMQAGALAVQGSALVGGILAVTMVVLIASRLGGGSTLVLVLAGLVVSALLQALTAALKYIADPVNTLPAMTFWLLGGLGRVGSRDVLWSAPFMLVGATALLLLRWSTQVLELGDDQARTLGIRVPALRLVLIVSATLMTAGAVSISGVIGWVGLLVPHLARLLVGPAYVTVLPVSLWLGAGYLLLVDDLCRNTFATELPLGVVTAILGAPIFVIVLLRTRRPWY